ncbi:MAG: hypothetical protein H7838_00100 [Magnetococcus sp. DMHC-8]
MAAISAGCFFAGRRAPISRYIGYGQVNGEGVSIMGAAGMDGRIGAVDQQEPGVADMAALVAEANRLLTRLAAVEMTVPGGAGGTVATRGGTEQQVGRLSAWESQRLLGEIRLLQRRLVGATAG